MNPYTTLFERYWNEAEHHARLYGTNPRKATDGAWGCNAVRRRLAEGAADNDKIADRIHDALKKGDLITDPFQDARYYTGPTPLLSPSPQRWSVLGVVAARRPPAIGLAFRTR